MKIVYRILAILGIAWAILIHPILLFEAVKGGQTQKIQALAAVTKEWMSHELVTNGVISLPEERADLYLRKTQEISDGHDRLATKVLVVNWISAVIIFAASLALLNLSREKKLL